MAGYIIFGICFGIIMLIVLPLYFTKQNEAIAAREEFEEYLERLKECDKKYYPHLRQLGKNLNIVNYWLKTGKDPTDSENNAEEAKKEDLFYGGRMDRLEARRWAAAVKKSLEDDEANKAKKSSRIPEFYLDRLKGMDFGQTEMKFTYSNQPGEYITYCGTPDALEKGMYKNVIFFTTARPTNLPLVYPYKYEGAQLFSLYKHPSQAIWFLNNWKRIREGLEGSTPEAERIDEKLAEFDL